MPVLSLYVRNVLRIEANMTKIIKDRVYPYHFDCDNKLCRHKMKNHDRFGCRIKGCLCKVPNVSFTRVLIDQVRYNRIYTI